MFLSRHLLFSALFAVPAATVVHAQMHHVDAPERVTRAVGVYEWTGDLAKPTAARFVPVSLFIDGHIEDAGLYLARPVPFAIQNGYVYSIERAGIPEGLLDLETARRVVSGSALADDNPEGAWYAFGKFTAEAAPKTSPQLHRSTHLAAIQSSPDPNHPHSAEATEKKSTETTNDTDSNGPHMTRRTSSGDGSSGEGGNSPSDGTASGGSAQSTNTGSSTSKTSKDDSADDADRPTLRRRDPSQDASRQRTASGKRPQASVTAVGPQPGDDPDRPTLSRSVGGEEDTKELTGLPPDLHQAVAVSDAVSRDPHPFSRPWQDSAERASTMTTLAALAKLRVAAYMAENHLAPSNETPAPVASGQASTGTLPSASAPANPASGGPPKLQRGKPQEYQSPTPEHTGQEQASSVSPAAPKSSTVAKRTPHPAVRATKATPLVLRDQEVEGFTLSYGGLPTFVYTANAPAALANPGDLPKANAHPVAFVILVAQRLPSGELQVALSAVTDSTHLDRSPRLRLIDAVDPDASHRASLLFELRSADSRQFALYRLVTTKAELTFSTASIE